MKVEIRFIDSFCKICKRKLNTPGDQLSVDCGGDCWACVEQLKRGDFNNQNDWHHAITRSPCVRITPGYSHDFKAHRFCDNECVNCGKKRPMLLDDKGNRSIFDDVDE